MFTFYFSEVIGYLSFILVVSLFTLTIYLTAVSSKTLANKKVDDKVG